ncbi:hypothetical protein JTE90_021783 [Oedothorax gibbosus]|uniref:Uncharacterized protein n=1 Tax=Oedothorax gibbosus TaxID=931172 RepID=A0AAV6URB0_9ARAC|nr:hypothetical protein JTE90_021783 [Oedothorax gibbosus]
MSPKNRRSAWKLCLLVTRFPGVQRPQIPEVIILWRADGALERPLMLPTLFAVRKGFELTPQQTGFKQPTCEKG